MSDTPSYPDAVTTPPTPTYPEPGAPRQGSGAHVDPSAQPDSGAQSDSTTDAMKDQASNAKDEAASVAADAKGSAQDVASTATDQAKDVATEAKTQARDLFHQARGEATEQAATQQQRVAAGLRSLSEELSSMAGGAETSGMATDVAQQASTRLESVSSWLESREPGDVLSEATGFARRRPGAFLAAAAAVGFLGGRLTRSLTADDDQSTASAHGSASTPTPAGGVASPAEQAAPVVIDPLDSSADRDRDELARRRS